MAAVIWLAQGQVAARRSRRRRPPRTMRPAQPNSRSRSFLGLPSAGGAVEGEHLHPGEQVAGQGDDLAPDLVLGVTVQRQVAQAGVLGAADPVLAPGPAAVPQLEVGQLPAAGAGGEAGEPVPVRSVNRSWAPGCGRSLRTITRIPFGQAARSSMPVSSATQAPGRTCRSLS